MKHSLPVGLLAVASLLGSSLNPNRANAASKLDAPESNSEENLYEQAALLNLSEDALRTSLQSSSVEEVAENLGIDLATLRRHAEQAVVTRLRNQGLSTSQIAQRLDEQRAEA